MRGIAAFTAATAGLLLLSGCSLWQSPATTGILTGVVEAGSPCGRPPPPDRPGRPCPSRPVAIDIQISELDRGERHRTRSDEQGQFRIELPAGHYRIQVAPQGLTLGTQTDTRILAGQTHELRLRLISTAR